jgi:hypothetical protein
MGFLEVLIPDAEDAKVTQKTQKKPMQKIQKSGFALPLTLNFYLISSGFFASFA